MNRNSVLNKNETNTSIREYFKKSKTDWYTTNKNGGKNWDPEKLEEFWDKLYKHKIEKEDYDFSDFVFPNFIGGIKLHPSKNIVLNPGLWCLPSKKTLMQKKVSFNNVTFEGCVYFNNITFLGNVSFNNCNFNDTVTFLNCTFKNEVDFYHCGFKLITHFIRTTFENNTSIYKTGFLKGVDFHDISFSDKHKTKLEELKTLDLHKISRNEFSEYNKFYDVFLKSNNHKEIYESNIDKEVKIYNFLKVTIKYFNNENSFSEKRVKEIINLIVNDNHLTDDFQLNFENLNLPKTLTFRRVNLSKIGFKNVTLYDTNFQECIWGGDKRIIFNNESENFNSSEGIYRQLKKNYESNKNWELSGLAYISEMEMRKKRLWNENEYFQWSIYSFYGCFGGYTQDFKKPIISLTVTIILFSFFYYFIDYDILKALQRGTKGALPYISIDTEKPFKGYWLILKNIELILGGTFLSFFILALRKRFKQ